MSQVLRLADFRRRHKRIFFTRLELHQLLSLYSRQVARGAWRDYAIDQYEGAAVFSVFRHTHASPLYTIVKAAPGAGRHGDYAVLEGRHRLASGAALGEVLVPLLKAIGPFMEALDGGGCG